jgi:putative transposase
LDYQKKVNLVAIDHPSLSLNYQTKLLNISRNHFYYQPVVSQDDIRIMGLIDRIFTDRPFYGSRRIMEDLKQDYHEQVNRKRVIRLMREMGLEAIYPKSRIGLSNPNLQHLKYPYLLKNLPILRPNQVWGTDITYIRLVKGFCYLVAIIDWFSRYGIAWRLSENMEIEFCLENLKQALNINTPEIQNSDQGSHFTSPQYTKLLTDQNIRISMDGRGRCMDNIFTERLWRSLKYENIYINEYRSFYEAKQGIKSYFNFYNQNRKHQSLNYQTPAQVYFKK